MYADFLMSGSAGEHSDERPADTRRRVLVVGARGFVGRYLCPALSAAGYDVVQTSRTPSADAGWLRLDVNDPESLAPALEGVDTAIFLVHQLEGVRNDYPAREADAAASFAQAARQAGVRRTVYLGGIHPTQPRRIEALSDDNASANDDAGPSDASSSRERSGVTRVKPQPVAGGVMSRHLRSRLRSGEILRAQAPSCIELRAAMIIGAGSLSWSVVRDLVDNLPVMLLPPWLRAVSWPVAIDDVVAAVIAAVEYPGDEAHVFDLTGDVRVTHRQVMERTWHVWRRKRYVAALPLVSPTLSAVWVAMFTRASWPVCRELLQGLRWDLDSTQMRACEALTENAPIPLDEAIALALSDEAEGPSSPGPIAVARMQRLGAKLESRWNTEPLRPATSRW